MGTHSSPSGRHPRLTKNVAPGIHRLQHANVNCYLVEENNEITVVDAAFPGTWAWLQRALTEIGYTPHDVRALVITHGHFDHMGFASRLAGRFGADVWVHPEDKPLAAHPYRYRTERIPLLYPLRFPAILPVWGGMAAAGALLVPGVDITRDLPTSGEVQVPGHPLVIFSPGHTFGHCALHFPDRDALITGDALVTLDPYTGRRGFQIVAGGATANSNLALSSLSALAATDATIVLPGHGESSRAGIRAAAAAALAAGAS
ncbi:MAG TPA: MBL fold metallo-hydrolase [Glaciihabitans sp.]|jgi:glyoxylase-like metal-dependent hydrolase (beta-lactamase superfamily II)|nr:MBL fold metallo-hydrolase [Glaciihabitans sp.]